MSAATGYPLAGIELTKDSEGWGSAHARALRLLQAHQQVGISAKQDERGSDGFTDQRAALNYLHSDEWQQKNDRRVQLIGKKVKGVLPQAEEAELEQLQQELSALLRVAHPQPAFDSDKLEAIKKRLQGGNKTS